nr:hypothetical protein [Enterococcus innesii]
MSEGTLYYTYLDECKRNYLTDLLSRNNPLFNKEEYSITSITFEKEYYQKEFEIKWENLRKKYDMAGKKAMHFVEYKKLIKSEERTPDKIGYSNFVEGGEFSEDKLKNFFRDLQEILESAKFYIVHTDFIWEKKQYLIKRNKIEDLSFKKPSRNVAPRLLNAIPYVAMRKHLDSLMLTLLKREINDNPSVSDGFYLDEELPKKFIRS